MLSKYRLPNQLPHEKVIKIFRRDLFVLFRKVLFFIILVLIPMILFAMTMSTMPRMFIGSVSLPLIILGTSAYYLFIWVFFFFSFIDYYLDIWIITNERIIDIQQRGFFSRIISEHKIFRIQDVTSEVHGIFPTVLAFGDVFIQTAGTKGRFKFHEIPNPNEVRDMIIKLIERKKREIQREANHNLHS